ncbi:HopJ type III effector protein [Marinobacter sp. X15-166B]|uniref:HopJ type III effector protein n=1 Tax=Marinobacter sp. X15-166B TaxID=1897620 RepID=UPI00085BB561|nr:HopJ type III effector protein [Marinobacter sp. X15-166B]OEY66868.1 type III effector HopPmaJ [Marinobacter sp. X15-166B]
MTIAEAINIHLAALRAGRSDFEDTLALVERFFDYTPTGFHNGSLVNAANENPGSCKVFALGQYCNLNEPDTLLCFGRHYQQVLDHPAGECHSNIRQFISTGWSGIRFEQPPLRRRPTCPPDANTEGTHA